MAPATGRARPARSRTRTTSTSCTGCDGLAPGVAARAGSGARAATGARRLHASGDALSTGAVKSETGLATSADGIRWSWEGKVLAASTQGWDRFTARLTTAVRSDGGWLGLYDGSADVSENYEERCGLATSTDLRRWLRIGDRPGVGAAGGPGTVRYVESVVHRGRTLFFFERTRADGA